MIRYNMYNAGYLVGMSSYKVKVMYSSDFIVWSNGHVSDIKDDN